MARRPGPHRVTAPVPSPSSVLPPSLPATTITTPISAANEPSDNPCQSQTVAQSDTKQIANASNLMRRVPNKPPSGNPISPTSKRPVIHTPRSRRTHVPVRQPPISKNLRWTASTVHTLLSSHPSLTHDANVLAARVADLAAHAAVTNCPSNMNAKSKLDNTSDDAKTPGKGNDLTKISVKEKRKGIKHMVASNALTNSADAEKWSCAPAGRNARRRVYDTLKVMAAAGCIHKQGKHLNWIGVDHLRRPFSHPPLRPSAVHPGVAVCFKRYSIARKMTTLAELHRRVRAYSQLHNRHKTMTESLDTIVRDAHLPVSTLSGTNVSQLSLGNKRCRTQAPPPRLDFPFLLVHARAPDLTYASNKLYIRVASHHPLRLFTETDVVCLLADRPSVTGKKLRRNLPLQNNPTDSINTPVCAHSATTQAVKPVAANNKSAQPKSWKPHTAPMVPTSLPKKESEKSRDEKDMRSKLCEVAEVQSTCHDTTTDSQEKESVTVVENEPPNMQEAYAAKSLDEKYDESESECPGILAGDYDISQIVERGLELPSLGDGDLDVDLMCPLGPHGDSCDGLGSDILGWIKNHNEDPSVLVQHSNTSPSCQNN